MRTITKIAAAAAVIAIVVVLGATLVTSSEPAYALEQTIEAIKHVRYMHLIRQDDDGQIADERWIEIGSDGFQVRYRQDSPPHLLAVEDGQTVMAHYKDKDTVVLYDPKDMQFQWIGNLGQFFEDMAGEGSVTIEEDVDYEGRPAHRVRWLKLSQDYYIDPESKLPIAGDGYEISYEEPPAGTFEIVIPDGVTVVDRRPGAAPSEEADDMQQAELAAAIQFRDARHALADGDYRRAAELFASVLNAQPGRNWAWFWLGRSYYEMEQYESAIEAFGRVVKMFEQIGMSEGPTLAYCYLARGMAYTQSGMEAEGRADLGKALGAMVFALRNIEAASMFDYADDPRNRGQGLDGEQRLTNMIRRLREATGQDFGYDPGGTAAQNEAAIAAWEDWWRQHAADYGVSAP